MMEEKDEMTALIKELFSANERLKEENKRLENEVARLQVELAKAKRGRGPMRDGRSENIEDFGQKESSETSQSCNSRNK